MVIAERDAVRGITDSRSPHELAALVLALDTGLFLQHLIDPDAITPELRANALAALIDPHATADTILRLLSSRPPSTM